MIYRENPNFVARTTLPNPREVSYWIDLTESPQGLIIKTWVSGKWVKINPSDASGEGLDLSEVQAAVANLTANKADKSEVYTREETVDLITASIDDVVDAAPGALDTLNELAAALNDDPNFATTIANTIAQKQDKLISGESIKTINGNSLLGSGNITILAEGGDIDLSGYITTIEADNKYLPKGEYLTSIPPQYVTDTELEDYALKTDIPDTDLFITEEEANATYQPKGSYLTSVPAEYVTESELSLKGYATTELIPDISTKQDTLVSGTNIKTINNLSILGQGNIEITTGTGGITDAPADGSTYGRKNNQWVLVTIPDTSEFATKEELLLKADAEDVASLISTEASSRAQEDNRLSNLIEDETEARETAVTTLTSNKLDKSTYNSDKLTFALKSEIPTDYLTAEDLPDTSNFATKTELSSYATLTGAQFTGTIGAPIVAVVDNTDGMRAAILSSKNDILFRTYNAGIDSMTFLVLNSTPLKITEAGIWENNVLLENTYAKLTDLDNLALKSELPSNVSELTNDAGYLTNSSLASYATQEYVNTQISNLVNSAPETLDTLNELAAALGDDPNFATTLSNLIGTKLNTSTYTADKATFATKTELSGKVNGTGITGIEVVTELPEVQNENILYIVKAA